MQKEFHDRSSNPTEATSQIPKR
jgi:hypothetical protein